MPSPVQASSEVALAWDANTENDLAGYKLFIGQTSQNYSVSVDVGLKNSHVVSGLQGAAHYFFSLKAYDSSGNLSDFSDEVEAVASSDATPPAVVSVTSTHNKGNNSISVNYEVSDASAIASVDLWLRINSSGWSYAGKSLSSNTGAFSFAVIADAKYYFAVVATDIEGNSSALPTGTGNTFVLVDSVAPTIATVSAPASQVGGSIRVTYSSVSDGQGSGIALVSLWVKNPSGTWLKTELNSSSASGYFDFPADQSGPYFFDLVAEDLSGNASASPSGAGRAFTSYTKASSGDSPDEEHNPPTTDLCPGDSKKTKPGVCGCGVVEDTKDTDRDGVVNCLDHDIDGDGVSNAQEKIDGTNPKDSGSVQAVVGTKVCTEWNGFLGSLWNILEVVNMSNKKLDVAVSLLDSFGNRVQSGRLSVEAGAQRDILIHDFSGRKKNQYGLFCLQHDAEPGDLDGRMVYYKGISKNKDKDFDFAFAMPFSNGLMGRQYVTFNTYNPSFRSVDQSNPVANWIQLTNLGHKIETGELIFYSIDGQILGRQNVRVAANQRIDFSGHQFGANNVGHVAWKPKSNSIPFQLRNVRYLYDNFAGENSFDTAFQVEGAHPSGELLVVPVDLDNSTAVVEIVNVTSSVMPVKVSFYDQGGNIKSLQQLYLPAHNSVHLIANEFVQGLSKAVVTVKGGKANGVVAVGMQYGRSSAGGIQQMYGLQAKPATGLVMRNSYNTYLQQTSNLVLINATSKSEKVSFSMVRSDGVRIVDDYVVTVPAHGSQEVVLNELSPTDQYGVVEIHASHSASIVAWVKRFRGNDYVVPTPSR